MSFIQDDEGVLLAKLKHAFSTYDSAIKKYLSAVKELDTNLETLAISVREMAQSETNEEVRALCDTFCNKIDKHKSATAGVSVSAATADPNKPSKGKKKSSADVVPTTIDTTSIPPEEYYFSTYMTDFSLKVSSAVEQLRQELHEVEKSKKKRDEKVKSYQKHRSAVDSMETKLAKKNQAVTEDKKYNKELEKREESKSLAEAENETFQAQYQQLLQKRTETLRLMVSGISLTSAQYYKGMVKVLDSNGL
ncbi:hypothetical protein, conserved [Angomonas deanei]|uniref:Uncharacterized protein n=1 Tax=Angomonas deanei TaxID=59799 RepID=A0A7G2CLJ2_9TRYP|nr:hypothetical protein, conserved [Angomonas deanei]